MSRCAGCGHAFLRHTNTGCERIGCSCKQYTAVDKPVDNRGESYYRDREMRAAYTGSKLPTPAEAEAFAQEQLQRRGIAPHPEYVLHNEPQTSPSEELALAIVRLNERVSELEKRVEYHDRRHETH